MDAPWSSGIASIPILEATKLISKDALETEKLLRACQTQGFFYLSLAEDSTSFMIEAWEAMLMFMNRYFDQSLEEKMKDSRKSDTHGYEPVGTSGGAIKSSLDHYESLKISLQECQHRSRELAPALQENIELLSTFIGCAHMLTIVILERLTAALGCSIPLASYHDSSRESTSTLAMFRYPQQTAQQAQNGIGHNKHTDIGTLTFLACQQWGLQVLTPGVRGFQWVEPKSNHVIINVGDSLRFLSGNKLLSAVHRVLPQGGYQQEHRHSIAYFLRPADDAIYHDVNGRLVTAKKWHDEKFNHFRATHATQNLDVILTGGMEYQDNIIAAPQ
ncbi:putative 2OG-Fe(II) oxygenase family oxidoreductase [Polychaeton citri CBS 116435]|uniref:2OG-Fe(II) oxygenase family oxidoreductase n=1 Tax=Polychaeton citri CBS 116435 TaxID=1314669 RepID=A0A9P4UJ45_9PEZI|nr:putative 2OG-Fe(II) oxygenase family oxidoreductase [Polychaeton citri CBS 116435]